MELIKPIDFTLPFIKKEQIARDTCSFYFDRTNVEFNYIPGHYIRMIFPNVTDPRGNSRLFSVASSPLEKDHIMITTKISQSPFKQTLNSLVPSTSIHFFGPVGRFLLDETDATPRICLAGGIGITPFHSMITYAAEKMLQIPITFFVSFSTVEEMIFYSEMMQASQKNPNIKIVYTITQPEESQKPWEGERGRISKELLQKHAKDLEKSLYMVAGPPLMVAAMIEMVKAMGIPDEQVKKEQFTGY